jgi:hypothetical protein
MYMEKYLVISFALYTARGRACSGSAYFDQIRGALWYGNNSGLIIIEAQIERRAARDLVDKLQRTCRRHACLPVPALFLVVSSQADNGTQSCQRRW